MKIIRMMISFPIEIYLNIPGSDSFSVSAIELRGERMIVANLGSSGPADDLIRASSDQYDLPTPGSDHAEHCGRQTEQQEAANRAQHSGHDVR